MAANVDGSGATAITVSQDARFDSERFVAGYGYASRQVFDPKDSGFEVSNAYGITNVPTVFLIDREGRTAHAIVGWSKADVEEIAGNLRFDAPLLPSENALPFKPGWGSRD